MMKLLFIACYLLQICLWIPTVNLLEGLALVAIEQHCLLLSILSFCVCRILPLNLRIIGV
jgi:hypothetical protein